MTSGEPSAWGRRLRIGFVCSAGGHLTQAAILARRFPDARRFLISYRDDVDMEGVSAYAIPTFFYKPWRTPWCLLKILRILFKERPDALISTGSEPAALAFPLAKILFGCKLIYVESCAQVRRPSGMGRLLYRLCDLFLVQSPALLAHYPKARYAGAILA